MGRSLPCKTEVKVNFSKSVIYGLVLLAPYSSISKNLSFTSVLQGSDLSEVRWKFLELTRAAASNCDQNGAIRCIVNPLNLSAKSIRYSRLFSYLNIMGFLKIWL